MGKIIKESDVQSDSSEAFEIFSSSQADHGDDLPADIKRKVVDMLDTLPGVKSLAGYAVVIKTDNQEEPASVQIVVNSKFPTTQRFIDAALDLEDWLNSDEIRDKVMSLPHNLYKVFSKSGSIPDDDIIVTSPIV
tara:strand:- start:276 stop:680 length:405 start_codon:yes stop_codon:yes gene_type:complete